MKWASFTVFRVVMPIEARFAGENGHPGESFFHLLLRAGWSTVAERPARDEASKGPERAPLAFDLQEFLLERGRPHRGQPLGIEGLTNDRRHDALAAKVASGTKTEGRQS